MTFWVFALALRYTCLKLTKLVVLALDSAKNAVPVATTAPALIQPPVCDASTIVTLRLFSQPHTFATGGIGGGTQVPQSVHGWRVTRCSQQRITELRKMRLLM